MTKEELVDAYVAGRRDFTGVGLQDANLRCVDLRFVALQHADLRDADLRDAILMGADLRGAALRGADLTGAYLSGVDLRDADLRDAILMGADLRDADLTGAWLQGAKLYGAHLTDADLSGADLSGATVRDSILTGAILTGTGLAGAILTGTDLTGAVGFRFPGSPDPVELRQRVADQIREYPELHDQQVWGGRGDDAACGTPCCVAGWACRLGGGTRGHRIPTAATLLLHCDGYRLPSFASDTPREAILRDLTVPLKEQK